jgi:hypothetical protein
VQVSRALAMIEYEPAAERPGGAGRGRDSGPENEELADEILAAKCVCVCGCA